MCKDKKNKTCGTCFNNDYGLCDVNRGDEEADDEPIPVYDDQSACEAWVSKY
jgi:hypothetical protein